MSERLLVILIWYKFYKDYIEQINLIEIFMYELGQIIGVVGFVFSIIAFVQKKDNAMRNMLGVSSSLVSVSYYLTGAYAGAFIILISAVRNFVSARSNIKSLYPVFLTVNILVGIYTFKNMYDIFPILGVICSTTSVFRLHGIRFRIGMLVACALWLVYNIIVVSIGPMMMETFNIIASVYSIYRIKKGERPLHNIRSE
jgi:hypothetical protein